MSLSFHAGRCATVSGVLLRRWVLFYAALTMVLPRAGAAICSIALDVQDTPSAAALAETVAGCTGGTVEVQWRGQVTVENAIRVDDGTVLRITGQDSEAEAKAGGVNGLFSVQNASLYVQNLRLTNGNATHGGAVEAVGGSTLVFSETSFVGNNAAHGGACFVEDSTASWDGETRFERNAAWGDGGAVFASLDSDLAWYGNTTFSDNRCVPGDNTYDCIGGAVAVVSGSTASWMAESSFFNNSADDGSGGAVGITNNSIVAWEAEVIYVGNIAEYGGAVCVEDGVHVSWRAGASYSRNTARSTGGAVSGEGGSSLVWFGKANFSGNTANDLGGAVEISYRSTALWEGDSFFDGNVAVFGAGGAVLVNFDSSATWLAPTMFSKNSALSPPHFGVGGAVATFSGASVLWEANTSFLKNIAFGGGAVFAATSSTASWGAGAYFSENEAGHGGAVMGGNSSFTWEGEMLCTFNTAQYIGGCLLSVSGNVMIFNGRTELTSNNAGADGGAVGTQLVGSEEEPAELYFNGSNTIITNNSCGVNGGAIALEDVLYTYFGEHGTVEFAHNSATVSGGAMFVSGLRNGLNIPGASFISNKAATGGAVYSAGFGVMIATESGGNSAKNPVEFIDCEFVNNEATATGGAVETGAGVHIFSNSSFSRNAAGVGGALRTAGHVIVDNCEFVENSSAEGGGAAISNIGVIMNIGNSSFTGNLFSCEKGEFLNFTESGALFHTVCDGCECDEPDVCGEDEQWPGVISRGETPLCSVAMPHTTSDGGHATVEMVSIERGWWRPTNTSQKVRQCYNEDACLGGLTGQHGFCEIGYKGPYCSVCNSTYTATLGKICTKCYAGAGGDALLVIFAVLALLALALFVVYMVSPETNRFGGTVVTLIMRRIPMSAVKIVIVMWQILTQFVAVTGVVYPGVYNDFLDVVNAVNFDLSWIWSATCRLDVNFYGRLVIATVGPIICVVILGGTYAFAVRRIPEADTSALRKIRQKHLSALLWLAFLVYTPASSLLFQTFACERLDDEELEEGRDHLRADYQIDCDSLTHQFFNVYAGLMILVYPIGIPLFFAYLLIPNRGVLGVEATRQSDERVASSSSLWMPYRPGCFFYELVQCARRVLLTGVVVFIYPDTAPQIAIALVIALVFAFASAIAAPYSSKWDAWVSRAGDAVVITSLYLALLLTVEVADARETSQGVFEGILVAANACMVAAVMAEMVVMSCSLRSGSAGRRAGDRERVCGVELQGVERRVGTISRPRRFHRSTPPSP